MYPNCGNAFEPMLGPFNRICMRQIYETCVALHALMGSSHGPIEQIGKDAC